LVHCWGRVQASPAVTLYAVRGPVGRSGALMAADYVECRDFGDEVDPHRYGEMYGTWKRLPPLRLLFPDGKPVVGIGHVCSEDETGATVLISGYARPPLP